MILFGYIYKKYHESIIKCPFRQFCLEKQEQKLRNVYCFSVIKLIVSIFSVDKVKSVY